MVRVWIRYEGDNGREFGYGVYVNAYIIDEQYGDDEGTNMGIWASECVPYGARLEHRVKGAARRVRQNALRRYKRELVG